MALRNIRGWMLLALLPVLAACGGGGSSDCKATLGSLVDCLDAKQTPVVEAKANVAPKAVTSEIVNALVKTKVELDGSNSLDENRDVLSYSWKLLTKPINSNAALIGATTSKPNFVPDLVGDYTLSFSVSDGKLSSPPVEIVVTVVAANVAPIAVTSESVSAVVKTKVELDGSKSVDDNRDVLSYSWKLLTKPANSNAVLSGATTPKPNFVADELGFYTLSFSVSDGKLSSPVVEIVVTAGAANVAPKAVAGLNRDMLVGGELVLDASGSTDANGDALTYAWDIFEKPTASTKPLLSASEGVKNYFVPDVVGTYRVRLVASDAVLKSDPVLVTITASNKNLPPVADVKGSDSDGKVGKAVNLDGSASSDPNGDSLTYAWAPVYPPDNTNTLINANAAKALFIPTLPGLYVFSLVVKERSLNSPLSSSPVNLIVTVTAP
jgi:hypothetical protein